MYVRGISLFRASLAASNRKLVATMNCQGEREIELAGDADFTAESDGRAKAIYKVDLQSGAKTLVPGPSLGTGEPLNLAYGLAVDATRQQVLAADFWTPSEASKSPPLATVDIATGKRDNFWTETLNGDGPGDLWLDNSKKRL